MFGSGLSAHSRARARDARSNASGRFDLALVADPDGWEQGEVGAAPLRTQVHCETPRSLISSNRSPDLPFDRSINPYRGYEHGCVCCFARPNHAWLGLSPGLDFENRLIARSLVAQIG